MAEERGRRDGRRRNGPGGGGGQPRPFISRPSSGDFIKKGQKPGTYDLTIVLGAERRPQEPMLVMLFVGDQQVGGLLTISEQIHAASTIEGIKLNESEPTVVRIEKAGSPNLSHSIVISSNEVKKSTGRPTTPAQADKVIDRFRVHVRFRADGTNLVLFETYAEDGATPRAGTITIDPGQRFDLNGTVYEGGTIAVPTGDDGRGSCHIRVLEASARATFTHEESRAVKDRLLIKGEDLQRRSS